MYRTGALPGRTVGRVGSERRDVTRWFAGGAKLRLGVMLRLHGRSYPARASDWRYPKRRIAWQPRVVDLPYMTFIGLA